MTFPVLPSNGPSGYNLTKSLRFRSSANAYLNRTPASASNQKTWTFSAWVKLGNTSGNPCIFSGGSGAGSRIELYVVSSTGQLASDIQNIGQGFATTSVFRDYSSWYHIVWVTDTTNATANNRSIVYVNNVLQSITVTNALGLNSNYGINGNVIHAIGELSNSLTATPFDGYMAEVNFVDGQALTPSSFGSTNALTGVWQPAKYTGTYGTNGFYLPFTNTTSTTTLGYDLSGNSNNWTTNNFSLTAGSTYDSMTDVPTLTSATVANYATWNALISSRLTTFTYRDGNLRVTPPGANWASSVSTGGMATNYKYYSEHKIASIQQSNAVALGITSQTNDALGGNTAHSNSASGIWYGSDGAKWVDGVNTSSAGATYTAGDIIGIAVDCVNNQVTFYKNNVSQFTQSFTASIIANNVLFGVDLYHFNTDLTSNFGQQGFTYTPPSGFVALNTYNLSTSNIVKGNTVTDATLYTGNGSSQSVVNASSFKPDFVWIKDRSGVRWHNLYDSVRGATKDIYSNATDAEGTNPTRLTSFNSNGFSVGSGTDVNANGEFFVGWQWQAGQGSSSSNTAGSITSTVSANPTAGFSIVTYTGNGVAATVGHGLGVAPSMIITKSRSQSTENWEVQHTSLANTQTIRLNTTGAARTSADYNNTFPTSSVFSLGAFTGINNNGSTYVSYCFAQISGYSAFGKYTGNGSSDGSFVYTGFRPKFILIKRTDGVSNWVIWDTARSTYNEIKLQLFPNTSDTEDNTGACDALSNGFKLRNTNSTWNASGGTYIYMAFAENPFKNALAR